MGYCDLTPRTAAVLAAGFLMLLAVPVAAAPLDDISTDVITLPEQLAAESGNFVLYEYTSFSPRLYLAPASATSFFAGWTDASGDGHVSRIADGALAADHEYAGTPVAGLVAHGEAAYAVLLRDDVGLVMRLRRTQADGSEVWTTDLVNPIAVPVAGIGDSRLAYGGGIYAARFATIGVGGVYTDHNGDQGTFVDDDGVILAGGWDWGPSHGMCQAAGYHDGADQLLTLAVSDCYPDKGIVAGLNDMVLLADGNCAGYVSVGFGQIAARPDGWLVLFNGLETEFYAGEGVGLLSIDFDLTSQVTWLTHTTGEFERDPVMARIGDGPADSRYLIGWRDSDAGSFLVALMDSTGSILAGPQDVSGAGVGWGNRDDSFRTVPGGGVAWLEGAAGAASIELHAYTAPPTQTIDIDPEPDAGSWELTGPGTPPFFAAGAGDSTFADMAEGDYSVVWLPLPGWRAPAPQQQTLLAGQSLVFTGDYEAAPVITEVSDVFPDQGGRVRLVLDRVVHDDPLDPIVITGYEVYRRQDDLGAKMSGWDYLGAVPAHGDESYQLVVPTLCDSTLTGGMCWSVFLVRAVSDDPYVFYESDPDSGYSVDDLAPLVPQNLALAEGILSWDECPDADFDYFTIYGSDGSGLEGAVVLDHTTGTSLGVPSVRWTYLLVTATDFAGNEGGPAILDTATGVGGAPKTFRLLGAAPNPFNPRTTISFELPGARAVDLRIYDASGRLVRDLVRGSAFPAGRHGVEWDGTDASGRTAPSGVYFYRLTAGDDADLGRMLLLK